MVLVVAIVAGGGRAPESVKHSRLRCVVFQTLYTAGSIVLLVVLGFATYFVGYIIAMPIVGHATWHVYRDVVETPQKEISKV